MKNSAEHLNFRVAEHPLRHVFHSRARYERGRAGASPRKGKTNAFTLIELLVVIAIISLLVSILLPSLTKAKELAQLVNCEMRMKSIGAGVLYYTDDNQGALPKYNGEPFTNLSGYNWGHIWYFTLSDFQYLDTEDLAACPSYEYLVPVSTHNWYGPNMTYWASTDGANPRKVNVGYAWNLECGYRDIIGGRLNKGIGENLWNIKNLNCTLACDGYIFALTASQVNWPEAYWVKYALDKDRHFGNSSRLRVDMSVEKTLVQDMWDDQSLYFWPE